MAKKENKTDINKKIFLKALERSLGIVTTACSKTNLSRAQFYKWMEVDPIFKKSVDDIAENVIDFAESKFFKSIDSGNVSAQIFFLKTRGRSRGYIEKTELDVKIDKQIDLSQLTDDQLNEFIKLSDIAKVKE